MKISNIFVTGSIQVGKSTVLNRVMLALPDWKINGFQTIPIYEENKRCGFILKSLDGEQQCFAHIGLPTSERFDIYHFDVTIFEEFGAKILEKALPDSELIILDEIGAMERNAAKFQHVLRQCLDSPIWVLGAFQKRAMWFYDLLLTRNDTKIFTIDETNREAVPQRIISLLLNSVILIKG